MESVRLGGITVDSAAAWVAASPDKWPFVSWVGDHLAVLRSGCRVERALRAPVGHVLREVDGVEEVGVEGDGEGEGGDGEAEAGDAQRRQADDRGHRGAGHDLLGDVSGRRQLS